MTDLRALRKLEAPPDIQKFMDDYGGNHSSLYSAWKKRPAMKTDRDALLQQLACAIHKKTYGVARRILGRIRVLDKVAEELLLKQMMDLEEDNSSLELGCLS